VDEIRSEKGIDNLPKVKPIILARLKLMRKKKGLRAKQSTEKAERHRYLNSKEFRDKMAAVEEKRRQMTYEDWVAENTSIGRERGGTCIRPDIFLTHNNKACDGCQCFDFCKCYQKRLSHEKRKRRR
jgi:hypothetical protein